MKKWEINLIGLLVFGLVAPALAVEFAIHGDMNNRFLVYTNHTDWFNTQG